MVTSDNQNEIFDIVDEQDTVIGKATRREVHRNKNLIHRSIGVFVFNEKGELLLQQRSRTKDIDPLKWDISCSGHVDSGRSYKESAVRELMEELGVAATVTFYTKYIWRSAVESEIVILFKTRANGPFKLHPQEIIQSKFFTQKELKNSILKGKIELGDWAKKALEKIRWI